MKNEVIKALSFIGKKGEIEALIEVPRNSDMGDYALPCFGLAKKYKKNPNKIAKDIASKVKLSKSFEKIEAAGPYVNFFVNRVEFVKEVISRISKEGDKYGSGKAGRNKKVVIEMSSPNIAKPFGIGHLRSTIIGNSIANISEFQGYRVIRINYLGDWGTQFGKIIVGYKRFGNSKKLNKDPIKHMLEIYIKANKEEFEQEGRDWFKKLENKNKESIQLWKKFKDLSLKEFKKVYDKLGVEFDVTSSESSYDNKSLSVIKELKRKKIVEKSEGALIVDLKKYGMGVALIQKSDGTTLYATRDLAAAIDRYDKYKFNKMFYEVGSEQKLYFRQLFKVLEMMGFAWAKNCIHIDHGLYLDKDGKKFATRKGKTIFMEDVLDDTIELAKKEIRKRSKLSDKELNERASKIAIAAIFYGDLKNYRANDAVFDIKRFLSFEGDTGPYLLYSYARAQSILRKAKYKRSKKLDIMNVNDYEKRLVSELARFPLVVEHAYDNLAPNSVANYSYELAKVFSEFYHNCTVIGAEDGKEPFRLKLVDSFSQTIKNALELLGINVIKEM